MEFLRGDMLVFSGFETSFFGVLESLSGNCPIGVPEMFPGGFRCFPLCSRDGMEVDGGGFPFGRCRKRVETPESSSMGILGDLLLTFPLLADIMEARKEIGNDLGRGNWTL